MSTTKMFRDRVVNLEQTLELGEKYLPTLLSLIGEVFPGWSEKEHDLAYEKDLFVVTLQEEGTDAVKRVSFTRMVLSDPACVPALATTPLIPARDRLLACLRAQGGKPDVDVTFGAVMDEEDRTEAERVDGEWRRQEEARLSAKRAEEERRATERRRQKHQEEERQRAQREKQRAERGAKAAKAAQGGASQPAPGQPRAAGPGRRKRRRKGAGGGANANVAAPNPPNAPSAPRPPQPQQQQQQRRESPPQGPRPEGPGGQGRRRRRRGRGAGPGGAPGGGPGGSAPAGGQG
jgi:uncharacterized protein YdaU (DUF1376 family)